MNDDAKTGYPPAAAPARKINFRRRQEWFKRGNTYHPVYALGLFAPAPPRQMIVGDGMILVEQVAAPAEAPK